jgi:hypothetical protein
MDKKKKTIFAIALSLGTVVLAIIAVITALKLKQISEEEIKPTVPEEPKAAEIAPLPTLPPAGTCYLVFGGPTETPTPTTTGTLTPTPTPTPVSLECWDECVVDSDCPGSLVCQEVETIDRCVNPDCPEEEDCTCPGETPTPTPTETATPTPTTTATPTPGGTVTPTPTTAALPEAGFNLPTLGTVMGGLLLVVVSLLFAL